MTASGIACIVADWGTSNLRAWALARDGAVLDQRSGAQGLLAVKDRDFAAAFAQVCEGWLDGRPPVLLSGMVGSKLGWKEAAYLPAPLSFDELGRHLLPVEAAFSPAVRIVPGVTMDDKMQPEVMRGEETQILGALRLTSSESGVFVLPGTHSKWALVEGGRLTAFRTYMTGEVFGLLRGSGTLSQMMEGDRHDSATFAEGVVRGAAIDGGGLLHRLFSVRTLGLLERMPRADLASYLSGLLIGAEIRNALAWLRDSGKPEIVTAVGSPAMLQSYREAMKILSGVAPALLESAAVVPPALFSIAGSAGLLAN